MEKLNTMFKLNVGGDGGGYKFVWEKTNGYQLSQEDADNLIPKSANNRLGPTFALSNTRLQIPANTFFLATVSGWNVKDEFGRPGLELCQGSLVTVAPENSNSMF